MSIERYCVISRGLRIVLSKEVWHHFLGGPHYVWKFTPNKNPKKKKKSSLKKYHKTVSKTQRQRHKDTFPTLRQSIEHILIARVTSSPQDISLWWHLKQRFRFAPYLGVLRRRCCLHQILSSDHAHHAAPNEERSREYTHVYVTCDITASPSISCYTSPNSTEIYNNPP